MMKKSALAVILCIILTAASGCGQEEIFENRDSRSDRGQRSEESSGAWGQTENVNSGTGAEESDVAGSGRPVENPYAIYQRFLAGEEPLFFRKETYFSNDNFDNSFRAEANKPYQFYEICNMINIVCNSSAPVNELSSNISYAYIDCGADGMVELAILFHDLEDYYDPEDVTLVIQAVDGRLEVCYDMQPYYRESWEISNMYGVIAYGSNAGTGYYVEDVGFLRADGAYHMAYSMSEDYLFYEFGLPEDFPYELSGDETVSLITYSIGDRENHKDYYLLESYDYALGDSVIDLDKLSKAVADVTGMEFCSYEEIQDLIAARETEIGLTEEIKNGAEVEWILLDEKGYDLIYGVESAQGVSDMARAIEAYRRFLSDRGHFKEILSYALGDGLAVNNDGMVDGFFLKDLDSDDIPELLIGMTNASGSQYVLIYKFDKESGRVKKDHAIGGMGGWFGCKEETYNTVVAVYPEFADSLLYTDHYAKDRQQVGYNDFGQLVWFKNYVGISLATDIMMFWCDYEDLGTDVSQYMEDGGYDFEFDRTYYEVTGSRADAERALQGYRPFLFYDITQENIDKYLVEDYLGAGMERYSQQDLEEDRNRFYRLYEEYFRGDTLSPTGVYDGQQMYDIEKLVQIRFGYY